MIIAIDRSLADPNTYEHARFGTRHMPPDRTSEVGSPKPWASWDLEGGLSVSVGFSNDGGDVRVTSFSIWERK